jgi:hypothetical protein
VVANQKGQRRLNESENQIPENCAPAGPTNVNFGFDLRSVGNVKRETTMTMNRGTTTLRGRRRPPDPLRPSNDNGNVEEEEEEDDDSPIDEDDQELLVQDLERRIHLQQVRE